jgi:hypothetical protein
LQLINTREYPPASPCSHGGQVEQQNKKPQNDEVITSIFDPPQADSVFCGLEHGDYGLPDKR